MYVLRLLWTAASGCLIKSDIFSARIQDSSKILRTSDLIVWSEHIAPYSGNSAISDGFRDLVNTVSAVLSNAVNESQVIAVQKSLDLETESRLSLNLFLSTPPIARVDSVPSSERICLGPLLG